MCMYCADICLQTVVLLWVFIVILLRYFEGWIDVTWDHGGSNSYRMGAEGKYDLKMAAGYDTSNTSEPVASGTSVLSGKSAASSAGKISFHSRHL